MNAATSAIPPAIPSAGAALAQRLAGAQPRLAARLRSGELMISDRLALFSLLAAGITLALLALFFAGQFRSLSLHARSVEGLRFGQQLDQLVFALARERDVAQTTPMPGISRERRVGASRRATDEAHAAMQAFLQQLPDVAGSLAQDRSITELPLYLQRLRARVDLRIMNEETTEALYSQAVQQMLRVAARVDEQLISPALGSRANSLLGVTTLVDEMSRQAAMLRRIEDSSTGGVLTQDRSLLGPLLDSHQRSTQILTALAAHSEPTVAQQARAIQSTSAHRAVQDFADKLALGGWSATFQPRWSQLMEDADKLVELAQDTRARMAGSFIALAERQAEATRRDIAVVTGISTGLVFFMGLAMWLLYRSIARPLRAITDASKATVAGRLDASIDYDKCDEVGYLARSLQVLIATITRFNAEMVHAREGVARGDLQARADGTHFDGAWRGLIDRFNDTLDEFAGVHRQLQAQAYHHPDSGLLNRLGLTQRVAEGGDTDAPCTVLLLQLVRLEDLGITLGADFAVAIVQAMARRLQQRFGDSCLVAQVGATEFAVVRLGPLQDLEAAAARLLQACEEPLAYGDALATTPGRVGVALGTQGDFRTLLTHATVASRRARAHVRPGYAVHDESYRLQREKARRIELTLPQAIAQEELFMVYQPVCDARTGAVTGFECLMRWRLADGSFVSPMDFITVAEETGHILALGEMALRSACRAFMAPGVRAAFPEALLSVNVSPRQLAETDFVRTIRDTLQATGMPARLLALEITESAFMDDPDVCIERIAALRAMGLKIYLDDFGTGYSSLSYLTRIPVDVLKIDQSFVRGRTQDPLNSRIVTSIVQLALGMGITPLAEGVESAAERDWLQAMGCHRHQGYLYGRPSPLEEMVARSHAAAP